MFWIILSSFLMASPGVEAHKFHVSYSRVAVEGRTVVTRIRFFKDDLAKALAARTSNEDLTVSVTQELDSLFLAYFTETFKLSTPAGQLIGKLVGSGEEVLGKEAMWWYLIEFEASEPITTLHLSNTLLRDTFDDQKNIVQVQHFPSQKTWSYYFVDGSWEYSIDFE